MLKEIVNKYFKITASQVITRLLTAWIATSLFFAITNESSFTSLDFLKNGNFPLFLSGVVFLWFFSFFLKNEKALTIIMIALSLFYCIFSVAEYSETYFLLGCCTVISGIVCYLRTDEISLNISKKTLWTAAAAIILLFTVLVGSVCALKYKNFWTPCYDFGIFAQMFHYMKETGQALVTCERDGLLSHFAVHFSPIFYLLLPFYCLCPSPVTLMISQCGVVALGIIPLVKLCRNHKLSESHTLMFALCYSLYPIFTGGCLYYLHENNFLAPLVLFLIYFLERKKTIVVFVFAILIFLVKEDAAVYVALIALYFIFANKNYKCNFLLLILSILYFICVTSYLAACGDGVMTGRYDNYIYDDSGLFSIIKAVIQNPIYAVQQIFCEKKAEFILQMLVPLGFMPLCCKKAERLILIISFLLVNVMTDYVYQYDINYQYGFGSGAILIYLSVINYADMGGKKKKVLLCALFASVIFFVGTQGRRLNYFSVYCDSSEQREIITEALELVPDKASLTCSTFFVPNVSDRTELYELESTKKQTEYYAVDLRLARGKEDVLRFFGEEFETLFYEDNVIGIFKRR